MKLSSLPERIQEKISVVGSCWLWVGSKSNGKHPNINWEGHCVSATRLIYELLVDDLPRRHKLWSDCEEGVSCVCPEHKTALDAKDFIRRYENPAHENSLKERCPRCGGEWSWIGRIKSKEVRRVCRACEKAHSREWRLENREAYLQSQRRYYRLRKKGKK